MSFSKNVGFGVGAWLRRCCVGLIGLAMAPASPAQEPVLAAGDQYSLAVNKDGVLFAWGLNGSGQLGDGTLISRYRPVRITGIDPVVAVAAGGAHSLALLRDKTVWAWGQNGSGQLGDNSTTPHARPALVPGLGNIVAIAAGHGFSMALDAEHNLWTWGRNNFGQLGDGSKVARYRPVKVVLPNPPPDFHGFTQIAAGAHHGMALDHQRRLYTWGDNFYGQLGLGHNSSVMVPTVVSNVEDINRVYAGSFNGYAISATSLVFAWGLNSQQQLGLRDAVSRNVPTCISQGCAGVSTPTTMLQVNALYAGYGHVLAQGTNKVLYYWGLNTFGQLGNQPDSFHAVEYPTTTTTRRKVDDMTVFAAGDAHSIGMDLDGYVYAWGNNSAGQLGNNNTTEAFNKTPAKVLNTSGVEGLKLNVSIVAGSDQTPDNIFFTPALDVGLQSEVRSSEVTVTGIDAPTPISISGGQYIVNPGMPIDAAGFRSANGTVNTGDRIVVRHFSAAGYEQKTTTVLTIGGTHIPFESTTVAQARAGTAGGGCTLVGGQRDISLYLLLLLAVGLQVWKKLMVGKCERRLS